MGATREKRIELLQDIRQRSTKLAATALRAIAVAKSGGGLPDKAARADLRIQSEELLALVNASDELRLAPAGGGTK